MKIKLWIFIDWYLPAYKAGGPIQSIANLVSRLKTEFDISVITSNTDLGEIINIPSEQLNVWVEKEGYKVMYLDAKHQNRQFYTELFKTHSFDVVYFNSLFSVKYTLLPFWLLRNKPIRRVLATRGMLGAGALAIKPLKKKVFLSLFKCFSLHKKVFWHATAQSEIDEIKLHFGEARNILLAPNLSAISKDVYSKKIKEDHKINVFFLSRISFKKNLIGALEALSKVSSKYTVRFNIIGPIDDENYWKKCEAQINALPKHILVNYLGAIPNDQLSLTLKEEHVLLLPTFHENFGHVIMESWQNGCPVIISDQTPWRNLENEKLGYDMSNSNAIGFTTAIEHFCKMEDDEYNQWSKSAFEFAKGFIENPKVLEQNKSLFLNA
ncbi:glycosyltransferase [Winogradskyella eckloniae]|uniref:glycosyltransferase n=1 Tax=Winogradskyella eckloniae TaxID=1089306 RepID=UPI0015671C8D|nr:glycosyltransferase [Winogradskyella eckloniae]NRD20824.1 glycosyltransferase [Winogradskyella eckloniae]